MTVREAATSGGRLETLRELRDVVAAAIDGCDSKRDLAALARRMQEILAEIDRIGPANAGADPLDEIQLRRMQRRAVGG